MINNLVCSLMAVSIIFIIQIINCLTGIYNNVILWGEKFNIETLKHWLVRSVLFLAIIISTTLLVSYIPYVIDTIQTKLNTNYNIDIVETLSIIGFVGIILFAAIEEGKKTMENIIEIIKNFNINIK